MSRPATVGFSQVPPFTIEWPGPNSKQTPTFPAKGPSDHISYTVDISKLCRGSGLTIVSASVAASYGLTVYAPTVDTTGTKISVLIGGGIPDSKGVISLVLSFVGGETLTAIIKVPISPAIATAVFPPGPVPDPNTLLDSFGQPRSNNSGDYE